MLLKLGLQGWSSDVMVSCCLTFLKRTNSLNATLDTGLREHRSQSQAPFQWPFLWRLLQRSQGLGPGGGHTTVFTDEAGTAIWDVRPSAHIHLTLSSPNNGFDPRTPQIPPCVGSNHALYIPLEETHLSPDCPVSLFKQSVLLVSFSFSPLLLLPFELHSFPLIIQLSLPFFFTMVFYVSILYPSSVFVSSFLSPEAVPLQMSSQRGRERDAHLL